ncbi:MAG TPA: sulfotransferase [Bryobacteraceae bacterium]|nr:sulfotransferase [Bryobacteraceae bacterium]
MRIHFISGLPRSGSTLLEGILRQNPRFHAAMSGPLPEMFFSLIRTMSHASDTSIFITDTQRRRILRSVFEAYYADLASDKIIFDTGRAWCGLLPALVEMFPDARVVCCLRNPAWILDSIERHVQRNAFLTQRMFGFDSKGNVYTRVEALTGKDGFVKRSLAALRQAWFGEMAKRLIAVRYESLTANPDDTIGRIYDALGEPRYAHDFTSVEYDEPQFDFNMGLPGFHKVSGPVRVNNRETILPPDIFKQHDDCFWNRADQNSRGVLIL